MKHDFIDKYGSLDSVLHRLDPRMKLVITLSFLILISSTTDLKRFGVYITVIFGAMVLSAVPMGYFIKKITMITPVAVILSLFVFLSHAVNPDHFIYPVMPDGYSSVYAVIALLAARIYLSILVLTLLVSCTRFYDLLWGLRQFKVPIIVTTLSRLVYTYIFIFIDELHRILRAYKSRTPLLRYSRIKLFGNIAGEIFLRSMDRSDSIYKAMLSRGFNGQFPEGNTNRLKWPDFFAILVFLALVTTVQLPIWNQ